jgi:hypothetical protein
MHNKDRAGDGPMASSRPERRVFQPWWRSFDLSGMHTKVLLKLLGYARRRRSDVVPMSDGTDIPVYSIRAELAKREHVRNKVEARRVRREAAKGGNRRRKRGGHRRRDDAL